MGKIEETEKFLWDQDSLLGSGACGRVYRGYDKELGIEVAIKDYGTDDAVGIKEMRILQTLDHKNIVKFYGVGRILTGSRKYIVAMEYCNGMSAFDYLQLPENANGLSEKEFVTALGDITAAEEYLRSRELIHRDWKPGNIVRSVDYTGKSIYKLVDFGTARCLKDGEEFETVCSTPAYMSPRMHFEGMLVGARVTADGYKATFDLWLIGASLYHLATSMLPFIADNALIRQSILSKKPAGAIAGIQQGDCVNYIYSLPRTCLLSLPCCKMITEILAELLQNENDLKWGFTDYFKAVKNFISSKILHLFFVHSAVNTSVCLPANATWNELNKLMSRTFDTSETNLHYIFNRQSFSHPFQTTQTSLKDIETSIENPLIVVKKNLKVFQDASAFGISFTLLHEFEKWVQKPPAEPLAIIKLCLKKMESSHDSKRDYKAARNHCKIAYSVKRFYEKACRYPNFLHIAITNGITDIGRDKEKLNKLKAIAERKVDRLQETFLRHKAEADLIFKLKEFVKEKNIDNLEDLQSFTSSLQKGQELLTQINNEFIILEEGMNSLGDYIKKFKEITLPECDPSAMCKYVSTCLETMEDILKFFEECKDKELSTAPSPGEKLIFAAKKKQFDKQCELLLSKVAQCLNNNKQAYESLEANLKSNEEGIALNKKCAELMNAMETSLEKFEDHLIEQEKNFASSLGKLATLNFSAVPAACSTMDESIARFSPEAIQKIKKIQSDLEAFHETHNTLLRRLEEEKANSDKVLKAANDLHI